MNKPFKFKKFEIYHPNSPLKVGTDGIMLGAWVDNAKAQTCIDIGTGTGVIAIMMAQKNESLLIDAVEIHEGACFDAKLNISNSPWADRINLLPGDVNEIFIDQQYDLIVTNPPFFINSEKNKDEAKTQARHTDMLSFDDIIQFSLKHLTSEGSLQLVLPVVEGTIFKEKATVKGLHLTRECLVRPVPHKDPHRLLMQFEKQARPIIEEELTIETGKRHDYTEEYQDLTRDFYIIF